MKKAEANVSFMQEAVWRMKEDIHEKTKHLNAKEFFRYIRSKSRQSRAGHKHHAVAVR